MEEEAQQGSDGTQSQAAVTLGTLTASHLSQIAAQQVKKKALCCWPSQHSREADQLFGGNVVEQRADECNVFVTHLIAEGKTMLWFLMSVKMNHSKVTM